jgi:hypothetical protein
LIRADSHLVSQARPASAARNCRDYLNAISNFYGLHVLSYCHNFASYFVADDLRWGKSRVTVIKNLGVGATSGTSVNAQLYFARSSFWFWNLLNL